MADYLTRACRLQLTTAMENLIRTAVFEISQIFEDSLHDYQMELARKGEEIAYLKVKLQRAELRLREVSVSSGSDQISNSTHEGHGASEETALQSPINPEIEYDGPDDWCIPLDSETVNKQENICPSVRLRQFSIPLSPIPLKHEAFRNLELSKLGTQHKDSTETGLQGETLPRRKRGRPRLPGNEKVKDVFMNMKAETPHKRKRGRPRLSENDKVKNMAMNIKEESFDIDVKSLTQRAGRNAKELHVRKLRNTNMKTHSNPSVNVYHCRFCPKVFDTPFGLSVHDRAHRKCKGCGRIFPLESVLMQHKKTCKMYKKLMNLSNVSSKDRVSKEHSSMKRKLRITPLPMRKRNLFTCRCCLKKFSTRSELMKHPCFVSCQICHKRLSSQLSLAVHTEKLHADRRVKKKDAPWIKPVIKTEEKDEDVSAKEKVKGQIKQCSQGYKCLICKKVYLSKYVAVEHTNVHTGEKPFRCVVCSQMFSNRNSLSVHRRKRHGVVLRKRLNCACSKSFFTKSKYKEHTVSCPQAGK